MMNITWNDGHSFQSSENPKSPECCQVSEIYSHSQVSKNKTKTFLDKIEAYFSATIAHIIDF